MLAEEVKPLEEIATAETDGDNGGGPLDVPHPAAGRTAMRRIGRLAALRSPARSTAAARRCSSTCCCADQEVVVRVTGCCVDPAPALVAKVESAARAGQRGRRVCRTSLSSSGRSLEIETRIARAARAPRTPPPRATEIARLEERLRRLQQQDLRRADRVAARPGRAPSEASAHAATTSELLFEDFVELHGDRVFGDDAAIVGRPRARSTAEPVVVIGHQKGRDTRENLARNFGMPHPEGYRKALRLMRARGEVRPARSSPSSTRRAPTRASARRSAARPRPSRATSARWPASARRSSAW